MVSPRRTMDGVLLEGHVCIGLRITVESRVIKVVNIKAWVLRGIVPGRWNVT